MYKGETVKNGKRKFISRVAGVVLGGVIGLTFFSGLSVGAEEAKNQQIENSVSVSENEKKSEQYYRTKTGKCYHKGNCKCLKKSKVEVTETEIKEADLRPCSKCCK